MDTSFLFSAFCKMRSVQNFLNLISFKITLFSIATRRTEAIFRTGTRHLHLFATFHSAYLTIWTFRTGARTPIHRQPNTLEVFVVDPKGREVARRCRRRCRYLCCEASSPTRNWFGLNSAPSRSANQTRGDTTPGPRRMGNR